MTPRLFAPGINSTCSQHPGVYFTSEGKEVCFSRMYPLPSMIMYMYEENGQWTSPQIVCEGLTPGLAPDESDMIFSSTRPGYGITDLYISFHNENGSWTQPKNMGPRINTSAKEACPFVTFDGKYLFFMSNRVSVLNSSPIPDGLGNVYCGWMQTSLRS
ncbi:MAG: PD40 domain-containing protein [Bacteroidales bacterium]|nr:PD40 domain-containing protein [Bacteroidales bacterium]